MTSKNPSFRRFVIALGVASVAATISGAWFLRSDAGQPSAADARVRLAVWDVYQNAWSYRYLEAGQVLHGAEGDIIELRPEAAGGVVSALPVFIDTISLPNGVPAPSESPATPVQVPGGPTPLPPGSWDAHGTPVYGRLKISTPQYTAGPFTFLVENPNYGVVSPEYPDGDPREDLEVLGPAPSPFDPGTPAGEVPAPEEWDLKAVDVNGSVGMQSVNLSVGADTLAFTWDISRWAKGDVFLGLNDASYKVLDRDGNFKRYLATAEYRRLNQYGGAAAPITTGCAANWLSGEVYMTNFSNFEPAVNVTLRHPGSDALPYSGGMSRRLSTAIFRAEDLAAQAGGAYVYPIDGSPESVAFDGNQNLYVGHSFPHYGTLNDSIVDPNYVAIEQGGLILYVDELGALIPDGLGDPTIAQARPMGSADPFGVVTDGSVSMRLDMDTNGQLIFTNKDFNWSGLGLAGPADERVTGLRQPNAYWEDAASGLFLETELNPGAKFAARRPLGKRLHRYNNQNGPLVDPAYSSAARDIFWTFTSRQGTDWIDLSADQRTMFYTSENAYIHRYDTVTGEQLPDFGTGASRQLGQPLERFHAMRILPPGDGSGGVLVAAGTAILRLNGDGVVVQQYQAVGDPDVIAWQPYSAGGLVQVWYSLEIDPSGRTFWASGHDTGYIYQFDLATGNQLQRKPAVQFRPLGHADAPNGRRVEGICIMWEYTAAQETCGDGIDNDNDGFIDESCTAIESCDARSPGDDDGDGFEDHNDTDCGDEQPPTAVGDQYVTNQGVALTIPANGVVGNDTDPDNSDGPTNNDDVLTVGTMGTNVLTLNAANVGVAFPTAQGGSVTLSASGGFVYTPATGFHGLDTFMYQVFDGAAMSNEALVEIRVRPLVANDSYTMLQKGTLNVGGLDVSPAGILTNDSAQPLFVAAADAGPGVTPFSFFKSITTPTGATVVVFENGNFAYQPLPAFVGVDSFVYQGKDAASDSSNTATVTITVEDVNELVAVNDATSTPHGTPVIVNVRANDVDPESHTFRVIAINGIPISTGGSVAIVNGGGSGTVTLNAAGNLLVTPNIGFSGLVTFTYTVEDTPVAPMLAVTSTARVDVTVGAPSISGIQDNYTTPQFTLLTVETADGVLVNDMGVAPLALYAAGNSSSMTVSGGGWVNLVTDAGGTVIIRGDGGFTYMPLPLFVGVDKFLYRLIDTQGTPSAAVAVFITVTPTSSVAVSTTPNPSVYGSVTPITAAVRCGGSLTPTAGTVTFSQGATVLAADVPVVNGIASASFPASLEVGNHQVTADYSGAVNQCPGGSGSTSHRVTPAPLVVTANPQSKAYGTTFTFGGTEVTAAGLLFVTDTVTGATLTSAGVAATATVTGGPYGITPSAAVGTRLNNYTITYVDGPLTVNPVPLVITASDRSKVYGTTATFAGTEFSAAGLVNGDLVTSVSLSSTGAPASAAVTPTYPIVPASAVGTGLDNYLVSYVNGTLTVTPKVLTVTALDRTKPYGTLAQFDGTEFGVDGLAAGDSVTTVTLTSVGGAATASVAGGPYPIVAAGAVGSGIENYTVEYVAGHLTVSPAPLTVTANAQSKVYGTTFTFAGTEVTAAGLLFATDTVTGATLTSAGVAATATVAGSPYGITPSAAVGTGLTNYAITYVNGPLAVTPRPLTVTADNRSKVYGTTATFAGTEFSVAGLVNGDLVSSVSLSSTGAPASAAVTSTYPIVPASAVGTGLDNYLVSYVNGTLTVTPKVLTVTALDRTKPYGTLAQFDGTEFRVDGLAVGDSVTTVTLTSVGGAATAIVAGGPYPIVAAGAVGSGIENYTVEYVAGHLTVSPAPLTVTANAQSKAYGSTFTFSGTEITAAGLLFATDTVTSATLMSAGVAPIATVAGSPYGITPSAAVGTGLTNYAITYANGPLTVNPVTLTITADNRSKPYGTTATFAGTEFSAVGLVNGDLVTSVSLSSIGAPASTPAGTTHPIVPASAVGPRLGNYLVSYVNGTLTVTPKVLTVTALDRTKPYGTEAQFAGTEFTVDGLNPGDSVTAVTLTSVGGAATASVAGGPYPIVAAGAAGSGIENYTVEYVAGNLTVSPAPLTVTANAQSKAYGTTFTFVGTDIETAGLLFATDTVTSATLTSAGAAATATVAGSPYGITPSAAVGTGLTNYTITYANGPLTVNPVPLTITANNRPKVYGTTATFAGTEFSAVGLLNGDLVTSVSLSSTGAPAPTPANTTHPIVPTAAVGASLSNYVVAYADGTLTVTPAPATVTAGSGSKVAGATDPTLTTTQNGFLASDLTGITLATTRAAGETVGTYPTTATATGTPLSNYTVTFVAGVFTITSGTPCSTSGFTTYSQGGWGSKPSGNNPGQLLASKFTMVYPGGSVTIGGTKTLKFTSSVGIQNFLPQGGTPAMLTSSATNPTSSSAGNFAAQVLALRLAVDFSAAGVTKAGLGSLVMASGPFAGQTVDQVLAVANAVLGGQSSALPSGMTVSALNGIIESLNLNFHEGTVNNGLLQCETANEPPCSATTITFTGNSATSGTAGNIRSFSTGGIAVKASAFSRAKTGGTWSTAYLGIWSVGMGVTDGSEGTGGNDMHKVDNGGDRLNYILFEFAQPVMVTKAYLDSIGADSDATVWVGNATNPYTNHLMLSDALLSSLGAAQVSDGVTGARWATFNGSQVSGNVLVIAAKTTDTNDAFKVSKLYVACASAPVNGPPVAVNDSRSTQGTTPVAIPVLTNDTDSDGDTLTVVPTGYTQPANGTVTLSGGVFTFVANAGFAGTTTFTYTISDGHGGTDVATVTVTVQGMEVCYVGTRAPQIGANQTWWANSDGTITIRTTVSRNFNDNTYGTTQIGWPGSNHKFNHLVTSDMIQIALYDNSGARQLEMKLDYFSASSSFPSGYGSRGPFGGDGAMVAGSLSEVTGADSSLARNFNQFGYQLTLNSPATDSNYATNATYPNWIWDVYYDVTVKASAFGSAGFGYPRIVTMHASPSKTGVETEPLALTECGDAGDPGRNGAPVAVNNTFTTPKATALTVGGTGLLGNDSDPDGDNLTVVKVNGSTSSVGLSIRVAHGYVKVNANGTFTYTPDSTYVGTETFTYEVSDGALTSAPATVTITISSHNDGDGCDHDRDRGDHHQGDNCDHDRDCDERDEHDGHHRGDNCDHDREARGHREGDNCDHDRGTHRDDDRRHRDGDGCDHDRDRNGHRNNDSCDHDRDSRRDRD